MKALIVSGTPQARAWVRAALGPAWSCDEADDGRTAIRIVREGDVKLLVADESTQPYGAFGLSREARETADPPRVIVILDREQDAWLASWSGADAWLVQPVDAFALRRVAEELLAAPSGVVESPGTIVLG